MRYMDIDSFYAALGKSVAGQEYIDLITKIRAENRGRKQVGDGYEQHHIHPVALGGQNVPSNLVRLSLYEHCKVHLLLAKAIPCNETILPIQKFSGRLKNLSLEDMEQLDVEGWATKRAEALVLVAKNNVEKAKRPEFRQKVGISNSNRITIHRGEIEKRVKQWDLQKWLDDGWFRGRSDKQKERLAAVNRQKAKDPVFRKKLSEATKKAHETMPEYNSKIAEAMRKHVRSEEHVRKLQEAHARNSADLDRNRRIAETLRKKVTITDGKHNKHVNPEDLDYWQAQGWYRGFYRKKKQEV